MNTTACIYAPCKHATRAQQINNRLSLYLSPIHTHSIGSVLLGTVALLLLLQLPTASAAAAVDDNQPPNASGDIPADILADILASPIDASVNALQDDVAAEPPLTGDASAGVSPPAAASFQFAATRQRPELNPVLSALIGEDVAKSIEAKRHIADNSPTTIRPSGHLTTTAATPPSAARGVGPSSSSSARPHQQPLLQLLGEEVNDGLTDDIDGLDAAGTENQKSRVKVKKGPNGEDYEYEFVYYYYDDEEEAAAGAGAAAASASSASTERGHSRGGSSTAAPAVTAKSRYTTLDRNGGGGASTTPATPKTGNELLASSGTSHASRGTHKARSNSALTAASSTTEAAAAEGGATEERLPQHTRFPPRGSAATTTTAATAAPAAAVASADESGAAAPASRKIPVRRPSLELVDSQSFNRDENKVSGGRFAWGTSKVRGAAPLES